MATVIKRQIRATPHRTATEAWQVIIDLIAPSATNPARDELTRLVGIAGQLIASESPKDAPIVVRGKGPRLRFYCLYDDDAVSGDDANENSLASSPTDGAWTLSIPAHADDLEWATAELKARSERVTARLAGEPVPDDDAEEAQAQTRSVNVDVFLNS